MRLGLMLILLVASNASGQALHYKAKSELEEYRKKMKKLTEEYQKSVATARADLNLKLSEIEKELIEDGKSANAKLVEVERKRVSSAGMVAKRLELEKALIGGIYKWDNSKSVWRFESNGTLVSLTDGEVYPWVALNDYEVLLKNPKTDELKILLFSDDRKKWEMVHMPKPTRNRKSFATRVK